MKHLHHLIGHVQWQLRASCWMRCILLGFAVGALAIALGMTGVWAGVLGFLVAAATGWRMGALRERRTEAVRVLHKHFPEAEFSIDIVLKEQPNTAERLQLERLASRLSDTRAPQVFLKGLWPYFLLAVGALFLPYGISEMKPNRNSNGVISVPDPAPDRDIPQFIDALVQVHPPAYTGISSTTHRELHFAAPTGAELKWQIKFSRSEDLRVVMVNVRGEEREFEAQNGVFTYRDRLVTSGLYGLRAYALDSLVYQSSFYRLEAIPDDAPRIIPATKELYRFHFLPDPKQLVLRAGISDDYFVNEVYIVATVARGSGENIKFREVKIPVRSAPFKTAQVNTSLDLEALNFTPGDELYYYWAAEDNRRPQPNFSRSDTYFLVYKDTAALKESELATMAMNILPEYFRSQRQIIIDTEKLIKERNKLSLKAFREASNEVGFDQKALRIRYGQYLGEEYESSIGGHSDGEDPLEGFMHKHDSEEEEHHHHEHHHHEETSTAKTESPTNELAALLEAYVHSHDDAESNTFYEQSTRSILKTALENMWQAELHLRLYAPEKALPYEYKALELLKEVQQKGRVFIAKTSYDPPPLKQQELRMKGDLERFNTQYRREVERISPQFSSLAARVLGYLEKPSELSVRQRNDIMELSQLISRNGRNASSHDWKVLVTFQQWLSQETLGQEDRKALKRYLVSRAANVRQGAPPKGTSSKRLEEAFWKNLE